MKIQRRLSAVNTKENTSEHGEILAASVPAKMAILTVEEAQLSDTAMRVIWTTPDSRGSHLTGYEFMVTDHDGNFQSAGTNLDLNVQVQDTFFEL